MGRMSVGRAVPQPTSVVLDRKADILKQFSVPEVPEPRGGTMSCLFIDPPSRSYFYMTREVQTRDHVRPSMTTVNTVPPLLFRNVETPPVECFRPEFENIRQEKSSRSVGLVHLNNNPQRPAARQARKHHVSRNTPSMTKGGTLCKRKSRPSCRWAARG